ncbi:MAG: sigma-70 family RNA polymerase sigma factor [Leeuwenhoekiella sp.]
MPTNQLDPTQWVKKYSDYLYNFTITRVNDSYIAQDLISETFLAGLKSMKNFKGQASERTWLISILKRKIIDHYRRSNSKKGKAEVHINYRDEDSDADWMEEQVADPFDKTAEDAIENNELGDAIYDCLDKLPERQAEIFKLKTIGQQETETICNAYNITASNLWVIIHRARTALVDCMQKNWLK